MRKRAIIVSILLLVGAIALSSAFGEAPEAAAETALQNEAQTATVEVTDKGSSRPISNSKPACPPK